ncbi:MAG: SH3 domain-containing protein [Rhizobiaceae bacterium]|nr:SH3 domain-containing protein [Rhizobiaceae bacterium]
MSGPKTTLLVLGAGCAAMVGLGAAAISATSFFTDLPAVSAQQASAVAVPPRKVKTVAIVDKPAEKGSSITPADRTSTASVKPSTSISERSGLHKANPRWARDAAPNSLHQKVLVAAFAEGAKEEGLAAALNADGAQDDPFAKIVNTADDVGPTIELASTVPDVPTPAPRQRISASRDKDDEPSPKAAGTGRTLTGAATLNSAANMRAAARSGSSVLGVVPEGARVSIAPGCEQWCEISYNGRRGFVYKDFIGSGRATEKPQQKADATGSETLDKAIYGDSNFLNSGSGAGKASQTDKTASNETATKKAMPEPSMR